MHTHTSQRRRDLQDIRSLEIAQDNDRNIAGKREAVIREIPIDATEMIADP